MYLIIAMILVVAMAGILTTKQTPIGMVAPGMPVEQKPALSGAKSEEWYKVEIYHHIIDFFNTEEFIYPQKDTCARIIEDTCLQIKEMKTSKMETFSAGKESAYKLILFEIPREILGKITLIKDIEATHTHALHLKLDKTIFTIKGWYKKIELSIALKGKKAGNTIVWEKGNITAEDFECSFGQ